MFVIQKEFTFEAAHRLSFLTASQPGHKCAEEHGHSYRVRVCLASEELWEDAFVVDYAELNGFKEYLDEVFDHHHLNSVFSDTSGRRTSAERLAHHFYSYIKINLKLPVIQVGVSETQKTWAYYYETVMPSTLVEPETEKEG